MARYRRHQLAHMMMTGDSRKRIRCLAGMAHFIPGFHSQPPDV